MGLRGRSKKGKMYILPEEMEAGPLEFRGNELTRFPGILDKLVEEN